MDAQFYIYIRMHHRRNSENAQCTSVCVESARERERENGRGRGPVRSMQSWPIEEALGNCTVITAEWDKGATILYAAESAAAAQHQEREVYVRNVEGI